MGKNTVLVKVNPEGKYVVDIDKDIDAGKLTAGARVALRNDSYALHVVLPSKIDPLVSLMKVEKVPDSTYDMVGGLDQQIKEIKEVRPPVLCCARSRGPSRRLAAPVLRLRLRCGRAGLRVEPAPATGRAPSHCAARCALCAGD